MSDVRPMTDEEARMMQIIIDVRLENKRLTEENERLQAYIVAMVEKAADRRLDGYRELGARCAALEAQIDALRAENERLAKEVNHWREARRTALLAGDVLKAENERLRADKDRLDWLDGTALSVDLVADPDGLVQVWYNTDPPMVSAAKGVRAAIDAAMKREGER